MNRNDRVALIVFIALILLGFGLWSWRSEEHEPSPPIPKMSPKMAGSPTAPAPPPLQPLPVIPKKVQPTVSPAPTTLVPKKSITPKPQAPSSDGAVPVAPVIPLHRELIPKDITIIRCYYSQEVAPPQSTFGFDIDGSGFTSEFEKMISVETDSPNIRTTHLHLVTPNQIHGDLEVGADVKTQFVFPKVLIKGLPVFQAPEPFAIIRPSEVLAIFFVQMQDNGRGGRFRVLTNLTPDETKDFKVIPTTPGLIISNLEPHPPYIVEGGIQIGPGVPPGEYGLTATIGGKEVFRRNGMIRIVRPTVGHSGLIHGVTAEDPFHRPSDMVQLYLEGTGLSATDATSLIATVKEFDIGHGTFTYISPAQMRIAFETPANIPIGAYSVIIKSAQGENLFEKKDAFHIVPANWITGIQVTPPVHAGQRSTLKLIGRDFSPAFTQQLHIETDESGVSVTALYAADRSALEAVITVSTSVAPGDYWLHLSADGQKITPPYGTIIKVEP